MAQQFSLGDPEFMSTSQLRKYCEGGRTLIRPLGNELRIASEELQAALKEVPSGNPGMFGQDSRVRARLVAAHMRRAADGVDATVSGLIRTFLSFEKHYINSTPERSKRYFDLNG